MRRVRSRRYPGLLRQVRELFLRAVPPGGWHQRRLWPSQVPPDGPGEQPGGAKRTWMPTKGADVLMVKPALSYLDHLPRPRGVRLPIAAYNVSGEYAMLRAAAEKAGSDYQRQ